MAHQVRSPKKRQEIDHRDFQGLWSSGTRILWGILPNTHNQATTWELAVDQRFWSQCRLPSICSGAERPQRPAGKAAPHQGPPRLLSRLQLITGVVRGGPLPGCRVRTSSLQPSSPLQSEGIGICRCLQCAGSGIKRVTSWWHRERKWDLVWLTERVGSP